MTCDFKKWYPGLRGPELRPTDIHNSMLQYHRLGWWIFVFSEKLHYHVEVYSPLNVGLSTLGNRNLVIYVNLTLLDIMRIFLDKNDL